MTTSSIPWSHSSLSPLARVGPSNFFFCITCLLTPSRVLKNSIYATYINEGPIENFQQEIAIFYIIFFIVFPFFFVNIFVALIIVTFQEQGESDSTDLDLDKNQVSLWLTFRNDEILSRSSASTLQLTRHPPPGICPKTKPLFTIKLGSSLSLLPSNI